MSKIRPREFTQEEADEFRLAMRDPKKWKELYEKVDKRNDQLYGDEKKNVNEYGFTDEEVTVLKESFPNDENKVPENMASQDMASQNMVTDDDLKFWDQAFEDKKGGRRRRKNRRTKKRTNRRSKKRTHHKKRHTKRRKI